MEPECHVWPVNETVANIGGEIIAQHTSHGLLLLVLLLLLLLPCCATSVCTSLWEDVGWLVGPLPLLAGWVLALFQSVAVVWVVGANWSAWLRVTVVPNCVAVGPTCVAAAC